MQTKHLKKGLPVYVNFDYNSGSGMVASASFGFTNKQLALQFIKKLAGKTTITKLITHATKLQPTVIILL